MEATRHANLWSDATVAHGVWFAHDIAARSAYGASPRASIARKTRMIFIVDGDRAIRDATRGLFENDGYQVQLFASRAAFLKSYRPARRACLLIDEASFGADGLAMMRRLTRDGRTMPYIVMSAGFTLPIAVATMKAGAFDLAEKPLYRADLLASMRRAFDQPNNVAEDTALRNAAALRVAGLTERQRQILDLVAAGHPSKNIAADLGISLRTVENHRSRITRKVHSESLPALIRTAACASCSLHERPDLEPAP
jgi:two-component system CheB/CheR fusion protein